MVAFCVHNTNASIARSVSLWCVSLRYLQACNYTPNVFLGNEQPGIQLIPSTRYTCFYIQVFVVAIGKAKHTPRKPAQLLQVSDVNRIPDLIIERTTNDHLFQKGDWFIVMDAHDVISFPQSSALNLTLKEALTRVGQEPYGFNAVALSIFFMQDKDGNPYPSWLPFKVFSVNAWNYGAGKNGRLWPAVDTLKYRVRMWRKGEYPVHFDIIPTDIGTQLIGDVHFVGRNVYPFHAQSLRFHPSCKAPYTWMDTDLKRMYALESAIGYTAADRRTVSTTEYLY